MNPLSVHAVVNSRGLDAAFEVPAGRTTALVGPNGAGKSTLLLVIAGLVTPDSGRVAVGDRIWLDTRARVSRPAHHRAAALLLQQASLFPHLSAADNVAFGARSRGMTRGESRHTATDLLQRVGASALADRRPHQLSGGQAARVAIARALAADPPIVLLDEPLAALDVDSAAEIREVLADVLRDRTALLVTHDVLDVAAVADDIVVLEDGQVVETGPVAGLLVAPTSAFLASLADRIVLEGEVRGGTFTAQGLRVPVDAEPGPARLSFDPMAVRAADAAESAAELVVRRVQPRGSRVRVVTDLLAADLPALSARDLRPGDLIRVTVDPAQVTVSEPR